MNIFKYQGQEEDHYTHILMCMLEYGSHLILPQFIHGLLKQASNFKFEDVSVHTRTKYCPQPCKPYEYVVGIAPYESALAYTPLEDNAGSIPDAWICGENFNLLFEFKIKGTLDEAQISAHKRLIDKEEIEVIRLTWENVMESLHSIKINDDVLKYLLSNYLHLNNRFKSKRRASGMPH
jgi:hypothetical protein